MDAVAALERLGGVAGAKSLLRLTTRRRLRAALGEERIQRASRGRYCLVTASEARREGARVSAVVCLRSAAAHYCWEQKEQPVKPELAVPRGRRVSEEDQKAASFHWLSFAADQVVDGVTSPLRTVIDCARGLPFDEALAIADSALRSGLVTRDDLDAVDVRGAGADAVRRVLRHADGRAANPFESVLRALLIDAGHEVEPQVAIRLGQDVVHPDLVDVAHRRVFEADSWSSHAGRLAHKRDCARYNLLVAHGWQVFRFTWEHVMLEPSYVRWMLAQLDRRVELPEVAGQLPRSA